jgi:hypothetical protein
LIPLNTVQYSPASLVSSVRKEKTFPCNTEELSPVGGFSSLSVKAKAPESGVPVNEKPEAITWLEELIEAWSNGVFIDGQMASKPIGTLSEAAKNVTRKWVRDQLASGKNQQDLEAQFNLCAEFLQDNDWIKKRDLGNWCKDGLVGKTGLELCVHFKVKGNTPTKYLTKITDDTKEEGGILF